MNRSDGEWDSPAPSLAELARSIGRIGSPKVLVFGDLMLDRYTWGDAERVSPEAPVLVLRAKRVEHRLGGAASVAYLLRGLEAEVSLAGVVGDDEAGLTASRMLDGVGIDRSAVVVDPGRPTTSKERIVGVAEHRHAHQILRVDTESRAPLEGPIEADLLGRVIARVGQVDAVLISDYAKGTCTPGFLRALIDHSRGLGKPVLVDPGRGVGYGRYRGATCLTPNRAEAREATGPDIRTPADAVEAARTLCHRCGLDAAIVTLDRDGMSLATADGRSGHFPARPRRVYDITGAGDMVLGVLGLALAAGLNYTQAIGLANVAGGLEVESVGVVQVTRDQVLDDLAEHDEGLPGGSKVVDLGTLLRRVGARRRRGERIAFTNGCFDLLHPGHLHVLQEASSQGDCLVVGLNSDTSVRHLKGPARPILLEGERAAMVAALGIVDFVCIFDDDTPHDLIAALQPDVLVKGASYAPDQIAGRDLVEARGGSVLLRPLVDGWSTTELIGRIRRAHAAECP